MFLCRSDKRSSWDIESWGGGNLVLMGHQGWGRSRYVFLFQGSICVSIGVKLSTLILEYG